MDKKFYVITLILLVVLLGIKIIIVFNSSDTLSTFSSYDGFEVEDSKIIKYNNSGGNVIIPKMINGVTITEIGDYAFNGLDIDSITIPNTITIIGDYAFANNNLVSLELPNSIMSIGEGAFMHNLLKNIELGEDVELGNACFNDNDLDVSDAFFYKNGTNNSELISYGGRIKGNIAIDNNKLTIIGEKAFLETYIISISLPNSVIAIKEEAFKGNFLVELYLSEKIEEIAEDAFSDNEYLTDIIINKESNSLLNYPWGANDSNLYWLKK